MMQDNDVRKRNELAIQDHNEYLEMLLDDPSHGVVVWEKKARPLYMNPWFAGMFGYSRKDWLKGQCRLRFHPDDSTAGQNALTNAVAGIPARCVVRVGKRDGSWRHIQMWVSPLAWRGKKLVLCTASDIAAEGMANMEQGARARTSIRVHNPGSMADPASCVSGNALMAAISGRLGEKRKTLPEESRSI